MEGGAPEALTMFHALTRIYSDGTQLQDERAAGAWRIVRMLDANAELSSDDALRRTRHHPAFSQAPDDQAVRDFDDATRASLVRTEYLAQATDAAAAFYLETTENEWTRDDPSMSAAGGPRTRTTLTGSATSRSRKRSGRRPLRRPLRRRALLLGRRRKALDGR